MRDQISNVVFCAFSDGLIAFEFIIHPVDRFKNGTANSGDSENITALFIFIAESADLSPDKKSRSVEICLDCEVRKLCGYSFW